MSLDTQRNLLKAIVKYNKVKDGPSGDAERDAGGELQAAAVDHLRNEASFTVVPEVAEMLAEFEPLLDGGVDNMGALNG
jgi:hypothetical protein